MLQRAHQQEYLAQADSVRPLPGAADLLAALTKRGLQWAIATSSYRALTRKSTAPAVLDWMRSQDVQDLFTTFSLTLAEIRYGIERLPIAMACGI